MGQLFLAGPTWDGNVASKSGRDELYALGMIERHEGWQWLNKRGLKAALEADVKSLNDQRWRKKQLNQ